MLAANQTTLGLLAGDHGHDVREFAVRWSNESMTRYLAKQNAYGRDRGFRFEYDGHILRCMAFDMELVRRHLTEHEQQLTAIDPLLAGQMDWMLHEANGDVLWWQDINSMQQHYLTTKTGILPLMAAYTSELEAVPLAICADWEFNAWACPAGNHGDFIAVNLGFNLARLYAAMFLEVLGEAEDGVHRSSRGIVASSMIWMAATVLGYSERQWDNLALPSTEYDRIWRSIQAPSDRLLAATTCIETFAMLHECAHLSCGHLQVLRSWHREEDLNSQLLIQRHAQMRAFELEADAIACHAMRSEFMDSRIVMDGLFILFSMLRLCEDRASSSVASTHPTASDRFCACVKELNEDAGWGRQVLERFVLLCVESAKSRLQWQDKKRNAT